MQASAKEKSAGDTENDASSAETDNTDTSEAQGGKTIVPFCTSGGSDIGSSALNLEELTSGAQRLPGRRLNGRGSQATVMEWVNGLGLDL